MLKVTRKTKQVEIILDQELAERIAALGDQLSRELTAEQVTEAGTNTAAKRTAKRIEELKEQAKDSTLILTLRAMPVSKWAQTLAANTVTAGNAAGTRDMFGTAADACRRCSNPPPSEASPRIPPTSPRTRSVTSSTSSPTANSRRSGRPSPNSTGRPPTQKQRST